MPAPTHPTAFVASVPPDTTATPPPAPAQPRRPRQPLGLWPMLLALLSAFALSQSYRTVTAIIATGLQSDFGLSSSSLGAFAGLFYACREVAYSEPVSWRTFFTGFRDNFSFRSMIFSI